MSRVSLLTDEYLAQGYSIGEAIAMAVQDTEES